MEQEGLQSYDVDLEEGEVTDASETYTPLQRPAAASSAVADTIADERSPLATCHQLQHALEDEEAVSQADSSNESTSGESSSDACLKKIGAEGGGDTKAAQRKRRKRVRRTVMVRVQPTDPEVQEKRARFKKYNVWTAALQEEALTENMRGCDVTRKSYNDRNVENYDYSLRYRINGDNSLKRRHSNSTDDFSDGDLAPTSKRGRPSSRSTVETSQHRRSVKSRLGHRSRGRRASSPTSGSDTSYDARHIHDLNDISGRQSLDVAREMAQKLFEKNDELLVRIVAVLGTELPMEIYKETQRIEADGGMMIKNGTRRRTPGGVFLFLLKHHEHLTPEQQKTIFVEHQQNFNKLRKEEKALSRDRKVEELKKQLSEKDKQLTALSTRKECFLLGSDLSVENQAANLSNPPPSPVGQEQSPEYKTHAINHVISAPSPEKPSTSAVALTSTISPAKSCFGYDDDFLDINCGEMDMF